MDDVVQRLAVMGDSSIQGFEEGLRNRIGPEDIATLDPTGKDVVERARPLPTRLAEHVTPTRL